MTGKERVRPISLRIRGVTDWAVFYLHYPVQIERISNLVYERLQLSRMCSVTIENQCIDHILYCHSREGGYPLKK